MNNGLPTLLDAIFGKQNLDIVSLEEIYELISEFPSFNAGHFLLSKKLKEQQESGYEKETMRTALYFNNPFWLESVLNEEGHWISGKAGAASRPEPTNDFSVQEVFIKDVETPVAELPVENFTPSKEFLLDDTTSMVQTGDSQLPPLEDNRDAELHTDLPEPVAEQPLPEYTDGPVTSFDDLISKYQIASLTTTEESPETKSELHHETTSEVYHETQSEVHHDTLSGESSGGSEQETAEQNTETTPSFDHINSQTEILKITGEESEEISEDYEIREEVVNEYGIFEEVKVKKTDFDLEVFDRPVIDVPEEHKNSGNSSTEDSASVQTPEPEPSLVDPQEELLNGTESPVIQEESDAEAARADYEAFDPPSDYRHSEETDQSSDIHSEEESISEIYSGHELKGESAETSQWESDPGVIDFTTSQGHIDESDPVPDPAVALQEHQMPLAPFDPKKAESIVFAPYHMIDYFASQGIKLNLEENPTDPLTRQLKSFTDWLKVMKKLPSQSIAEKTDDQEVDRIRHFAAHSIDEREILTESMAEVLAKQGMYENAIALFQKLSLIYPPKSAYFASRIEQIKASLP